MSPHVESMSRYVPAVALDWERRAGGEKWLQVDGTLLFVDISGFTNLSERLATRGRIGAEELTSVLDSVFGRMLDLVHERGGSLLKFGGDALLLLFEGADHPVQGVCSAIEMRSALRAASQEPTSVGRVALRMSSGLHTGPVDLFLVGSTHSELIVTGPTASVTTEMESAAGAGEILVSTATAACLPTSFLGAVRPDGVLVKKTRPSVAQVGSAASEHAKSDPTRFVPVALREHLAAGLTESEHRIANVGFIKYQGVDRLLTEHGGGAVAAALDDLVGRVQDAADAEKVTFLATDIDRDGGKVILTTGVPTGQHDDEGRILRALRTIVDGPSDLTVQAGVNRGHVFAGNVGGRWRSTYTVMGDTVNLAARLMTAAGPGRLFSAPSVLDLAATLFRTEALDPFPVKGKTEPVRAFEVLEEVGVKPPESEAGLPFHGRETELETVVGIVTTCAQVGRGGMLTIVGGTGVGKSRLINEVLDRCPENMDVGRIRAEPYGSDNPYWALRDPLRRLLDVRGSTRQDLMRSLRNRLKGIAPHLAWASPLLGDVMHVPVPDNDETAAIDPRFRPSRTADVLVELFDAVFRRPLALVVEDAQWLDGATTDLLARIGEAAESRPWTVIFTARDESGSFRPLGTEVSLRRLGDEAMRSIAVEATANTPLRPHELDAVVARADGNPLFLSEILAVIRETGSAEAIPDSLDAVISKQIDTLPPLARQVLRHLSVLGRSFRTDLAREFLSEAEVPMDRATDGHLDGFIEADGPARSRFKQAVVHDVAYGGLPYRRRRELHALAGSAIERMAGDFLDDAADLLALHFSVSGDDEKAWHYSRLAGDKAKRAYANVEAANHYQRAVEAARSLADSVKPEVAEVWARLGEVRDLMGHYEEAREAFSRAAGLAGGNARRIAELNLRRAESWFGSGNLVQAKRSLTTARRALARSRPRGATALMARIDAYESSVHAAGGDPPRAHAAAERAIESGLRSGEEEALARAYGSLDWANFMMGSDAPRRGEEAVAIFTRLGQVDRSAMTMNMMGAFAYFEGDWDGAVAWYERSVEAAELSGNAFHAANTRANIAEVLIGQRRFAEAIPFLEEAGRFFRASGSELVKPFVDLQTARARAGLGDSDLALAELERLFALQLSAGDGFSWPEVALFLAETLARTGQPAEAAERLDRFEARMPESATRLRAGLSVVRARIALAAGDHSRAREQAVKGRESAAHAGDLYTELLATETLLEIESGVGMNADPALEERVSQIADRLGATAGLTVT